jgi:hypothetical protein
MVQSSMMQICFVFVGVLRLKLFSLWGLTQQRLVLDCRHEKDTENPKRGLAPLLLQGNPVRRFC